MKIKESFKAGKNLLRTLFLVLKTIKEVSNQLLIEVFWPIFCFNTVFAKGKVNEISKSN